MNPLVNKAVPFTNSWKMVAIMLLLVTFQPNGLTLFSLRISDFFMFYILLFQKTENKFFKNNLKEYNFIRFFGITMGIVALIATLLENSIFESTINFKGLAQTYRWFKYTMIFIIISNVKFTTKNYESIIRYYVIALLAFTPIIYAEFYDFYNARSIVGAVYYSSFSGKLGNTYYQRDINDYVYEFDNEDTSRTYRAIGFAGNTNAVAIFYALGSCLLVPLILFSKRSFQVYISIGIYFLFISTILIAFGSRTAIVAVLNGLIVGLLYFVSKRNDFKRIFFFTIIIYGVFMFLNSRDLIQERIFETIDDYNKTGGDIFKTSGRDGLWEERINNFNRYGHSLAAVVGMGYTPWLENYADNGYLSSFLNRGIIGAVYHIAFFILILIKFRLVNKYLKISLVPISLFLALLSLIYFEFSAEMIEDIRIGQVFFVLVSLFLKSLKDTYYTNEVEPGTLRPIN